MIWILMILTVSLEGGNQANSQSQMSVEFKNQAACVKAAEEWKNRTEREFRRTMVLCTPKEKI